MEAKRMTHCICVPVRLRLLLRSTFVFVLFFAHTTLFAGNGTKLSPARYLGVRPIGMGDAVTSHINDFNALYYNPAGLSLVPHFSFEILNPTIGFNSNLLENMKDFRELAKVISSNTSGNSNTLLDKIEPLVRNVSGENHYVKFSLNPHFVIQNFAFGVYSDVDVEVVPHAQTVPNFVDLDLRSDLNVKAAYSHDFFNKKLSVGIGFGATQRSQILADNLSVFDFLDATKTTESRKELLKDKVKMGWTFVADTGVIFSPIETWKPAIGVSILNVGDSRFKTGGVLKNLAKKIGDNTSAPDAIPQSVNLGMSVSPQWDNWVATGAVDFRDINLALPASQKPSLGLEGGWRSKYFSGLAQTGLNEGYLTAGFELRMTILTLRYATYKTDRGYFPKQNNERRHLIQAKILL
jgi:hypothetical protein